ncbi:MAG: hypothetical protein ACLKAK_01840 [Alkaliphilus sp.]
MEYNSYIIIIGCIIVIGSVILIIKENRFYNKQNTNNHSKQNNYNVRKEIATINNEIGQLAENVELILKSINLLKTKQDHIEGIENEILEEKNSSFNNTLKYQMFEKKNEKVIYLYKSGITVEEIAEKLNKSYREVEMIVKLLK